MRAVIKIKYGGLESFCEQNNLPYHKSVRAFEKRGSGIYEELFRHIANIVEVDLIEVESKNKFRGTIRREIKKKYRSLRNFAAVAELKYYDVWRYFSGGYYDMPEDVNKAITDLKIVEDGIVEGGSAVSSC